MRQMRGIDGKRQRSNSDSTNTNLRALRRRAVSWSSAFVIASALGIVAVVVGSGPASGQAPAAPSTVLSVPKAVSPLGKPGVELVERRTRSSRTYLAEDGRGLIAQVFQTPVNYRDGSGAWRAIDSGLDLVDGAYRSRANRFAARLPRSLAGGEVRFSEGIGRVVVLVARRGRDGAGHGRAGDVQRRVRRGGCAL